jgi:V8-like Glu-specific endopeptidase
VKLNMKGVGDIAVGSCTGTIVTPRVVLTAAHCLDEDVQRVRVWLGSGEEILADSFVFYPNYAFNQSGFDVGVIFMGQDLPRTPVPILTSRDGQVGETAIIAGWGRDENSITTSLRAGSTTLSAVTGTFLQTQYAPPSSSVCSGDSGGPIMLSQGGVWTIAGITSATSSDACNTGTNFYQAIRTSSVRDFILQHVPSISQR